MCVILSEASVRSLAAVPAGTAGSPPSSFRSSLDPLPSLLSQTPRSSPLSSWFSNRPLVLSQGRLTRLSPPSRSGLPILSSRPLIIVPSPSSLPHLHPTSPTIPNDWIEAASSSCRRRTRCTAPLCRQLLVLDLSQMKDLLAISMTTSFAKAWMLMGKGVAHALDYFRLVHWR